ncbi:hypothetical protein MTO96_024220 [Rhipicephalus appendiculatus]
METSYRRWQPRQRRWPRKAIKRKKLVSFFLSELFPDYGGEEGEEEAVSVPPAMLKQTSLQGEQMADARWCTSGGAAVFVTVSVREGG